jgi:diacylglycerol kinase
MKNQSLLHKFIFAWQGFIYAIKNEHNMQRHIIIAILTLGLFAWLGVASIWWALIVLCIGLILAAELANSAIESLIDHLHPERHEQIGHVKDMLAAMVLILSISAVTIGLLAIFSTGNIS